MKVMKTICCLFLGIGLMSGCAKKPIKMNDTFMGPFDTAFQVIMYEKSERQFEKYMDLIEERFTYYHSLFDKYNNYEGINNIKTINDKAGIEAVKVDEALFHLIELNLAYSKQYSSKVNIALGPVLDVWHGYRELNNGSIPTLEQLEAQNIYTDASKIELNQEEKTVFLKEKGMSLDVGATAKGYAAELVKQELIELGLDDFLISAGGNIVSYGQREIPANPSQLSEVLPACLDYYTVDIQSPGDGAYKNVNSIVAVILDDSSAVTSGDYQRYFMGEDGKKYHHLINPDTLYPQNFFRSVTIFAKDSMLADFLSSAVFLLPFSEGRSLIESIDGVEAVWLLNDGNITYTSGLREGINCHFYE